MQLRQHQLYRFLEFRDIALSHHPDPLHVQPKIIVDQNVSKSRDAHPFHLWPARFQAIRKPLGALSEDLQVPDNGVLSRSGCPKDFWARSGIFFDSSNAFQYLAKIKSVVLQIGTASRNISSRIK